MARDDLGQWPIRSMGNKEPRLLSNIVLMGMGEPLYNFDNVRDAMKIAMDPEGICISRRRITLSTSGVVPEIAKTAEEIGCLLAVSFHATTDEVRNKLVPINKKWNIEALIKTLREYPKLSNSERITFEYVMLLNVNDDAKDALALIELLGFINCKLNIIPYNEIDGIYKRPDNKRVDNFLKVLDDPPFPVTVRWSKGQDIDAGCGQLATKSG